MEKGCLLCINGQFIRGPYPQQVNCQKYGLVLEREACEGFKGQLISVVEIGGSK